MAKTNLTHHFYNTKAFKLLLGGFVVMDLFFAGVLLAIFLPKLTTLIKQTEQLQDFSPNQVLAAANLASYQSLAINLPTQFTDAVTFGENVTVDNNDLNLGTGRVFASNIISQLNQGIGISILVGDNNTPTITNTDPGSAQTIFKNITVNSGTTPITAASNSDTLNLAAGNNIGLSLDADTNTITIANTMDEPTSLNADDYLKSGDSDNYTSGTLTLNSGTTLNILGTFQLGTIPVTSTATELNLLEGITAILDEDNMISNSSTALASQQSIKAYVDAQVLASGTIPNTISSPDNGHILAYTTSDSTFHNVAVSGDLTFSNLGVATIQDNSVDGTDISVTSETMGDLIYYNGTDWIRLAPGASGTYLRANGAGVLPTWDTPVGVGDVSDVGDCSSGGCFTSGSITSTSLYFYDGDSHHGLLKTNNLTSDVTYTLPNTSGEVSLLGQTIEDGEVTNGLTIDATGSVATAALSSTVMLESENISLLTNDSGYITDGNTNWDNSYGFITASSSNTLTNKSGAISMWTNDTGYVTTSDDSVSGSELDGVFSTTGLLKRTGANTYTTITDNSTDWDTAFGWGNHSLAGYITTSSTDTLTNKSGNISMWTNDAGYVTSGADAGTIDGLDSTQFLRSDTSDNLTSGTLTLDNGTTLNILGTFQIGTTTVTSSATELNLLDGITAILDEDTMASNSNTALATQQSIKAYVDTAIGGVGGGASTLDDLTDVAVTAVTNAQMLIYDGTTDNRWENVSLSGDISISYTGVTSLAADSVSDNEIDYTTVTLADFTNDSGYITDGNTNWDNSYGFITASSTDTLTNKSGNISMWTNDSGYVTTSDDSVSGSELDGVFSTTGLLKRTGANTYTTITDNSTNWDTAFGWGDHSLEGYITASSTDTLTNKSGNISMWTNDAGYVTSGADAGTIDGLDSSAFLRSDLSDTFSTNGETLNFATGTTLAIDSGAIFTINGIDLTTAGISVVTSGASVLGAYTTGFTNSSSSTVQAVLGDFDIAISTAALSGADQLNDLSDVTISSISNAQLLIYDGTSDNRFENVSITGDISLNYLGVTTISDNSVDGSDIYLGSETLGDILYYNGTDWVKLQPGADGTYLRANGAVSAPTWDTPIGAGDITDIGTCSSGACFTAASTNSTGLYLYDGNSHHGLFQTADLSSDVTYTFPAVSGTIWTSGNDGSGSTLDADLWDGNNFAAYLDQTVLTTSSPTFAGLTLNGGNLNHTASGNPTLKGSYDTPDRARAIYTTGNYAYIADETTGILIIDISNPASPTLIGTYNTSNYASGIFVSGRYAYIADYEDGLHIVDISNPYAPTLKGSYDTSSYAWDVYVSGKYAYIADDAAGLTIVDISNPASPTFVGSYNTSGTATDVTVSGKYAYIGDSSSGLQIIDISDPTSPSFVGTYNTSGDTWGIQIVGKYAYIADKAPGLRIVNISDPSNPSLTGTYDTTGSANHVFVSGRYAYIADDTSGLQVVDISAPASPQLIGTYDTSGTAYDISVMGKYAYIADYLDGLKIIDINGIETPSLTAGNIQTNSLITKDNGIVGNNLYVSNSLNVGNGGIITDGNLSVSGSGQNFFAGNVGIGDTTPNHKLDVAGNIGLDSGSYVNFGDTDGSTGYGVRDNAGAIEYKDSADSGWTALDALKETTGQIAAFSGSCPAGWSEYTSARGRYIVGTPSGGTNAATVGTALSDQENRAVGQHSHTVDPASTALSINAESAHTHAVDPPSTSVSITDPGHAHGFTVRSLAGQTANIAGNSYGGNSYTASTNSAATGITAAVNIASFSSAAGSAHNHTGTVDIASTATSNSGTTVGTNAPYIQLTYCQKDAGSDYAEWIQSNQDLPAATIVSQDPNNNEQVIKTTQAYDPSAVGIIATQPGWIVGNQTQDSVKLALSGRVPVMVSLKNGEIKRGDAVTTSSIPGVGMKATKAGQIIGKAMEPLNEETSVTDCWDPTEGRSEKCGTITVFVNLSWYSPLDENGLPIHTEPDSPYMYQDMNVTDSVKVGDIVNVSYSQEYNSVEEALPIQHTDLYPALNDGSTKDDLTMIGIISDDPDEDKIVQRIRENGVTTEVKALITEGVTKVNISPVSQPIHKGDFLGASNVRGAAAKLTNPGFIIAKALEDWQPDTNVEQIQVQVLTSSYYDPSYQLDSLDQYALQTGTNPDGSPIIPTIKDLQTDQPYEKVGLFSQAMIADLQVGKLKVDQLTIKDKSIDEYIEEQFFNLVDKYDYSATLSAQLQAATVTPSTGSIEIHDDITITDDLNIGGDFYSFGRTFLSDTYIAGTASYISLENDTQLDIDSEGITAIGTTLKLQPTGLHGIDLLAGQVTIDQNGNMHLKGNLTVEGQTNLKDTQILGTLEATGSAVLGDTSVNTLKVATQSAGIVTIPAFTQQATITFPTPKQTTPIINVTPIEHFDNFALFNVNPTGFSIKLETPTLTDRKFNYLIIDQETSLGPDKP